MLRNKRIILGVTGSIAAYKSVELLRLLTKAGADVRAIMTQAAREFVRPLTFQALSANSVHTELFNLVSEKEIGHISLADWADLVIIAPATANIIGKIANGIADDLLSTVVMATKAPTLIAPAMNVNMFTNPIYEDNEKKLRSFGYLFVSPEKGTLACGWEGMGKLAAPETIFEAVVSTLTVKDLANLTIMVTAGPTREEIDPVRFISNYSSGKMGYALARNAVLRGARVILVSGPVDLATPLGVELVRVSSAEEMRLAVMKSAKTCSVIIKAAAVADYRPVERSGRKVKKKDENLTLSLTRNTDILAELGALEHPPLLVGFAAETDNLEQYAHKKLRKKNLDMIVANEVGKSNTGFNAETNRATLYFRDGRKTEYSLMPKNDLATVILDHVLSELSSGVKKA